AGIVYQPSKSTSLYCNWSNYFNPVYSSTSQTGELFKPQTSEQFEVGIKQEFLNSRLSTTLAFYQITRQNLLTPDPTNPLYSIQTGEQKSRGIELDVTGQILPGWKVIATYT
ncbi:MAG: TonB-dependent receptor domain-containing protein, partial [Nostoc sp.]